MAAMIRINGYFSLIWYMEEAGILAFLTLGFEMREDCTAFLLEHRVYLCRFCILHSYLENGSTVFLFFVFLQLLYRCSELLSAPFF